MTTQTVRISTSDPDEPMRLHEIRLFLRLADEAQIGDDAPVMFEQVLSGGMTTLRGRSCAIAVDARRARPTPETAPPLETK